GGRDRRCCARIDDASRLDAAAAGDSCADADSRRRRGFRHTACRRTRHAPRHRRFQARGDSRRGPSQQPRAARRVSHGPRALPRPSGIVVGVRVFRPLLVAVAVVALLAAFPRAQESLSEAARRKTLDQLLDLYVRNGDVYYRALKADRRKLDGCLNSVAAAPVAKMSRDDQIAFWLNAYNALVLRTVVDHYPIQGHSAEYPPRSIRQIPGAFERLPHRVGGRTLTLDQLE